MRRFALAVSLGLALSLMPAMASAGGTSADEVAPTVEDMVRNVQLPTILNARDLGGLRGTHGVIPHGRFFRAATLARASVQDRQALLGRGVTLDIDLRTSIESIGKPDRLSRDRRFGYQRISLLGVGLEDWFRPNMRGLYLHTLDAHQSGFREVFHRMATYGGGAILYHCTSGKDRTGMITAILLDLAGVGRDVIVRDYAISAHYLMRAPSNSPPEAMAAFLDALHAKYGGARAFLSHVGLPDADVQSLLAKLGQ